MPDDASPAVEPATKVCPDCAETVKAAAKVCRFCGYRFEASTPRATPADSPGPEVPKTPEARPQVDAERHDHRRLHKFEAEAKSVVAATEHGAERGFRWFFRDKHSRSYWYSRLIVAWVILVFIAILASGVFGIDIGPIRHDDLFGK